LVPTVRPKADEVRGVTTGKEASLQSLSGESSGSSVRSCGMSVTGRRC
jgi:hypothetical protein